MTGAIESGNPSYWAGYGIPSSAGSMIGTNAIIAKPCSSCPTGTGQCTARFGIYTLAYCLQMNFQRKSWKDSCSQKIHVLEAFPVAKHNRLAFARCTKIIRISGDSRKNVAFTLACLFAGASADSYYLAGYETNQVVAGTGNLKLGNLQAARSSSGSIQALFTMFLNQSTSELNSPMNIM